MRRRECGSRRDSRCESEHGNLPGNASRFCVEISPILDNQVKGWSDYFYLEPAEKVAGEPNGARSPSGKAISVRDRISQIVARGDQACVRRWMNSSLTKQVQVAKQPKSREPRLSTHPGTISCTTVVLLGNKKKNRTPFPKDAPIDSTGVRSMSNSVSLPDMTRSDLSAVVSEANRDSSAAASYNRGTI